VVRTAFSVAD